jgi:predicted Zn-dependent protease with MMP-like domain
MSIKRQNLWYISTNYKNSNILFLMDDDKFKEIIGKAVEDLPQEFKDKIENVAIVAADWPSPEQLRLVSKEGRGGLLLGLYQGIPKTKRGNYGIGPTLPDKITIFKIPLLTISKSYEEAVDNIKDTVIHEIAHHFGMTDEDIKSAKSR